jgi:metal-responsive CopG/Arc/MetJ family transcriptional regulator
MSDEYKRFTVSLPSELYENFEEFRKGLEISRSDGVRKAMKAYMVEEQEVKGTGEVVGCITMVLTHKHSQRSHGHFHEKEGSEEHDHDHSLEHEHDHDHDSPHEHDFKSKPFYADKQQADLILSNDIQHHYAEVIHSTMHIHLEFEKCLEIIAVSGPLQRIKKLKEALQALNSVISLGFFVVDKK